MPTDATAPLDDTQDSTAYRWTIRALYATALGLNVWLLWQHSKDDPEFQILTRKARQAFDRATRPVRLHREWQRSIGRMIWQATEAVEQGAVDDA